jgi:ribosomal protein S4
MTLLYQNSRRFKADFYGDILFSKKPLLRLFSIVYSPRVQRDKNFVLRIDQIKPIVISKPLKPFMKAKLETRKLRYFYQISRTKLLYIVKRVQGHTSNIKQQLIFFLESQIWVVMWRTQFFIRSKIKHLLLANKILKDTSSIPKLSFHVMPGEIIKVKQFPHFLYERLCRNQLRLRESHLFIDYQNLFVMPVHYKHDPFMFFKCDYNSVFYKPQSRVF